MKPHLASLFWVSREIVSFSWTMQCLPSRFEGIFCNTTEPLEVEIKNIFYFFRLLFCTGLLGSFCFPAWGC